MPWGKVDDNFYDHPKLELLPEKDRLAAVGLHWIAISWCNRWMTDGLVPTARVLRLGGTVGLARALVRAGLWEEAEGGFQVHDYLEFNQSKAQIQRGREQRAQAGRAGGMAKQRARESSSTSPSDPSSGSLPSRLNNDEPPTRPVPASTESLSDESDSARAGDVWDVAIAVEKLIDRPAGFSAGGKVLETLRADVAQLGSGAVIEAMTTFRREHPGPMDSAGLVFGTHNVLYPLATTTRNGRGSKGHQASQEDLDDLRA